MAKYRDLVAESKVKPFGRLTVLERGERADRGWMWLCECSCAANTQLRVKGQSLTSGNTMSCGCLRREMVTASNTTHGMTYTPTYAIWCAMKGRCGNPNNADYEWYGGREIRVCERWLRFEHFLADMGERPDGYSIERGDVNGNYEPGNCTWIPLTDQWRNRRNTFNVTHNGVTQTLIDWARQYGLPQHVLRGRLVRGIDFELAVQMPVEPRTTHYLFRGELVNMRVLTAESGYPAWVIRERMYEGLNAEEAISLPYTPETT